MLDNTQINKETFEAALKSRERRDDLQILIVEDQKFSRLMLKNFLAKNYSVIDVATGEEALAEYIKNAPDIVFLDIELPKISGHNVLKLLTQLDKNAFIVMVTANSYQEDARKADQFGAKGFVVKPYTKDKIYESIDKFIAAKEEENS